MPCAVYLMSLYNTQIDFCQRLVAPLRSGLRPGPTFVALTTLTMSRISQEKMGNATGIFNLMRNLGGSFGIATATTLLSPAGPVSPEPPGGAPRPFSQPFMDWQHRMGNLPGLGSNWRLVERPPGHGRALPGGPAPGPDAGLLRRLPFLHHRLSAPLPLVFLMRRLPRAPGPPGTRSGSPALMLKL